MRTSSRTTTPDPAAAPASRVDFAAPPGMEGLHRRLGALRFGRIDPGATADSWADEDAAGGAGNIVIVTSMPVIASGLSGWFDDGTRWRVRDRCGSVGQARTAVSQDPAVVLATDEVWPDARPPDGLGLPAGTPVMVLTIGRCAEREAALVRAGATAVLATGAERADVLRALEELAGGRAVMSAEALRVLTDRPPAPELTARQRDVLALLAEGRSTSQIAESLVVTPSTVKAHLRQIGDRFGLAGQRALAVNARHLLDHGTLPAGGRGG